ncbi:MAG TPA: NifU N-terminal domain-containing protein [Dehalococcoidia bacterium]|nr:NifU N-terminal domain-containing protein [Dehalococcoidia bacterium]
MSELRVIAQATPNPETMKFTLDRMVAEGRGETYANPTQAFLSPLARALFAVPGVAGVFLLKDFVTIRRAPGEDWQRLAPAVEAALRAYFAG